MTSGFFSTFCKKKKWKIVLICKISTALSWACAHMFTKTRYNL